MQQLWNSGTVFNLCPSLRFERMACFGIAANRERTPENKHFKQETTAPCNFWLTRESKRQLFMADHNFMT